MTKENLYAQITEKYEDLKFALRRNADCSDVLAVLAYLSN